MNISKEETLPNARKLRTAAVVLIVIAGGLAFTAPGHRVLHTLGFTAACDGGDCN